MKSEWIEKYGVEIRGKNRNKNNFSSCEGNRVKSGKTGNCISGRRVPLLFDEYFSAFLLL